MRSFLDMAGYYRKFVEGFSNIARPFIYSKACHESFEELKKRLTTAPMLTISIVEGEYVIYNDALYSGLGSILMQDGRVVAYASRQLKVHDVNYLVHDLELPAVVFLLKLWMHFVNREILGSRVITRVSST